jgi:pyruvate carboxylase
MIRVAPTYAANMSGLFSMECWAVRRLMWPYRFLQECLWQRLRDIRPCGHAQYHHDALLRASNGVGHTNYPADNVVQEFVRQAAVSASMHISAV